jgi:hypothetical protein
VRDFATLVSDRRQEIDGTRWRRTMQRAPNPGRPHAWDDGAQVIRPAARISDWTVQPVSTLQLVPARAPAALDAGAAGLPFADRVSQLLHHAAMPIRLEPLRLTQEHRCLASGGNAHGVALWLRLSGSRASRLYRLDIAERCLIAADPGRAGGDAVHAVELIPVARMAPVIKTYGEFGLCLLLLEGGMMQAQLMTLAAHLGLAPQRHAATQSARFLGEGGHNHWSSIVLPGISLVAEAPAPWPAEDRTARLAVEDLPRSDDWPLLQQMMRAIQQALDAPVESAPARPLPPLLPQLLARPFSATAARTSGEAADMPGAPLAAQAIMAMIDAGAGHARALDPGGCAADVSPHLFLRDEGGGLQLWAQAPGTPWRQSRRPPPDPASAGLSGDVQAVLTLHAGDGFARHGDAGGFARAFLAAGQIVQGLCLAGPGLGAFVRPHKAIPDTIVNAQLPIGQRALVQVHIGAAAPKPLRYPLI